MTAALALLRKLTGREAERGELVEDNRFTSRLEQLREAQGFGAARTIVFRTRLAHPEA